MATEFKREHGRYVVIKDKDLTLGQRFALNYTMQEQGIPAREGVVIEAKWPIYEPAWDMVQRFAEGREQRIVELEALVEQHKAAEEMQIALREKADEREAALINLLNHFKAATIKASMNGFGQDDEHHDDSWIDDLDHALTRAQHHDAKLRQQSEQC